MKKFLLYICLMHSSLALSMNLFKWASESDRQKIREQEREEIYQRKLNERWIELREKLQARFEAYHQCSQNSDLAKQAKK